MKTDSMARVSQPLDTLRAKCGSSYGVSSGTGTKPAAVATFSSGQSIAGAFVSSVLYEGKHYA